MSYDARDPFKLQVLYCLLAEEEEELEDGLSTKIMIHPIDFHESHVLLH